jgi:hypothetical protein
MSNWSITVDRRTARQLKLYSYGPDREEERAGREANANAIRNARETIRNAMRAQPGDTVDVDADAVSTICPYLHDTREGWDFNGPVDRAITRAAKKSREALESAGYW